MFMRRRFGYLLWRSCSLAWLITLHTHTPLILLCRSRHIYQQHGVTMNIKGIAYYVWNNTTNTMNRKKNRSNTLISRPLARAPTTAPHKQDSMRCNNAWSEWHRQRFDEKWMQTHQIVPLFIFIFHIYNYIVVDVLGALLVSLAVQVCVSCVFVYCIRTFTFCFECCISLIFFSLHSFRLLWSQRIEWGEGSWKSNGKKHEKRVKTQSSAAISSVPLMNINTKFRQYLLTATLCLVTSYSC